MTAPFDGSEAMPAGRFAWVELMSGDAKGALAFYGALFGWQQQSVMNMGEDEMAGGIMNTMPEMPANWRFYANITDFDAAVERVKARGGNVINGPMQVPGGGWIVNFVDDQGGYCSLIGMR